MPWSTAKIATVAGLGTVGVGSIIGGGIAPTLVQNAIVDTIPTALRTISDEGNYATYTKHGSDSDGEYGGPLPASVDSKMSAKSDGTTNYYFYNLTNGLAVMESGATPELQEIHVAVDWKSVDFDISFSTEGGEEVVSYQTWSHYEPTEKYAELMKQKITQVNPVYFAGVASLAGTEKTVFMGLSYMVMDNMGSLYNETMRSVAAGLCRANVAYAYDATTYAAYADTGGYCAYCDPNDYTTVAGENACTGDKDSSFGLFGNYSLIQNLIEKNAYDYGVAAPRGLGTDSILYSDYIYNAIGSVDQTAADSIVVEPEISTYLRTGNTGCTAYGAFSQYYWNYYWLPDAAAASQMQTGCDFQMTNEQTKAFFEAFSDETFSKQFLGAVYAWYVASNTGYTAASPSPTGISNSATYPGTSYSYRTVYYMTDLAGYGMSLQAVLADSRCVNAGINYGNAFMAFQYLGVYAPEQFMMRGFIVGYDRDRSTGTLSLQADGTGNKNSGLITTHTIEEFLFGWNDTLAEYITTMSYNGLVGKQYDSIESQTKNQPAQPWSKFTGKDNTDIASRWYANGNGTTSLRSRDQLGYTWSNIKSDWVAATCAEEPWISTNYGSDDCYIWSEKESDDDGADDFEVTIKDAQSGPAFKPFFELSDKEYIYADTFKRMLSFTARSGDQPEFEGMPGVTVDPSLFAGYDIHGIKTIRYDMDASNFENSTANEVYYMGPQHDDCTVCADTWMMPMDRISYYPVAFSKPYLCDTNPNVQSKVTVTRSADTENMECSDVAPYIAVEPLTGMTLERQLMFQANWQMSTTMLDGTLFTNAANSARSLPFFWTGQTDTIGADDAATLKGNLFDAIPMATVLLSCLVPFGAISLAAMSVFVTQWDKMFPTGANTGAAGKNVEMNQKSTGMV